MNGPDTQHPDYKAHSSMWKKCRDVVAGEDAVHAAGEEYLARLSEQKDPDYKAYVQRTPFYNATSRTIDGLVGMVMRKQPLVTVPASMDDIVADVTLTGCAVPEMAETVLRQVIEVGRVGMLVEYPMQVMGPLTQAQASAMNRRPYCSLFKAEHIINWRSDRINNAMQPVMVVLSESVTEWKNDFESEQVEQRRALLLVEGVYLQRLYRKAGAKDWAQVGTDIIPLMNGVPMSYIPFVMCSPTRNGLECSKPPIYDLVTLNLSHYRTIADYEHGAHFTGLPMLFLAGIQLGENEKVIIGSQSAVVSSDPNADGKYLEFTGQGLGALKDRAAEKEAGMAAIGARMLAPEKQGVEAQGTLAMRHAGESAVLSVLSKATGVALTRVLEIMAKWEGITGEILVTMNADFMDLTLTPQEIDSLVKSWQAGAISYETLFDNLKRGEIIPEGREIEEEQGSLETQGPQLGEIDQAA